MRFGNTLRPSTSDLHVDVGRAQRIRLNEVSPLLHLIPHLHREHPIRVTWPSEGNIMALMEEVPTQ
jgi:hypothetical protein